MASETTSNASPSLSPLRLTEWTSCGGCAAKWGANLLKDLVDDLAAGAKPNIDPALLVGLAPFDDAAVYQVSDDVALVSTTDFFPPLVDDPDDFGAIAAANACSDVFAMGGRVVMAVNIAAFPEHSRLRRFRKFLRRLLVSLRKPVDLWRVVTRYEILSRSSGLRCRALCIQKKYFEKVALSLVMLRCCRSHSALV